MWDGDIDAGKVMFRMTVARTIRQRYKRMRFSYIWYSDMAVGECTHETVVAKGDKQIADTIFWGYGRC